ncbi:MAG: dephospho-CoA kinase [Alistipes sp.]|nr:dephospho-CoA kinase [Alistipes sp.]
MVWKVGLTGGIGSGKSTVSRLFALLGVPVYDTDSHAKRLMQHDPNLIQALRTQIGAEAYTADGKLNRAWLAQAIFRDPTLRARLNEVVHPVVFADFDRWAAAQEVPYVMQESAILFESGAFRRMDCTVEVSASEAVRIARTILRDNVSAEAVKARMAAQLSEAERCRMADYVIVSDDRTPVIERVLQLHQLFLDRTL